ncbi:NYN domain-containing protein [Candidatus Nitrospira bockiana]
MTHLIIDGYNLLGQRGQVGPDAEQARERLLEELARYRQQKGYAITVVFDAWRQGPGVERHEHRAGVEVIYSKRGEQADQVIRRLAAEFAADSAVVSSDREVAASAKAHGAFIIGADEFEMRLRGGGRRIPNALAGKGGDEEEPVARNPEKKGNPRKLPKKLRQRAKQMRRF